MIAVTRRHALPSREVTVHDQVEHPAFRAGLRHGQIVSQATAQRTRLRWRAQEKINLNISHLNPPWRIDPRRAKRLS
jgi:hypothetical protein